MALLEVSPLIRRLAEGLTHSQRRGRRRNHARLSQREALPGFRLWVKRVRPNPSLELTHIGVSPRPPSASYHVAPVGRRATPLWSAQLKR